MKELIRDFHVYGSVEESTIQKYQKHVPELLTEIWKNLGYGSYQRDFLKIINPEHYEKYMDLLKPRAIFGLPIMATGMGDLIVWEDGKYVTFMNCRKNQIKVIAGKFPLFLKNSQEDIFGEWYFDWKDYLECYGKGKKVGYQECLGYVPLLEMGGRESSECLKPMEITKYLELMARFRCLL